MAEKDAADIFSNLHDVCPPGRSHPSWLWTDSDVWCSLHFHGLNTASPRNPGVWLETPRSRRTVGMAPLVFVPDFMARDPVPFAVQRSHQAAGREAFDVTSEPQKTKGHRPTETIHLKTVI